MPRVVLVLHEDTLGGASRVVLRPVERLAERGWKVSVWCARPSALYDDLQALGIEVDGAPRLMRWRLRSLRHPPGMRARLGSLPSSLRAFARHLRAQRPDLVCVNGRLALTEGFVARLCGFRVVAYLHDDALPGLRGVVARVAPWIAAHDVLAESPGHAETLRVGRRRARVVPGGTSPPEAPVCRVKCRDAPAVVGTVGVPSRRKGTDLFVQMGELLQEAGANVELRIAGEVEDGPEAAWARDQLARGARAGVRHLGHVDIARELTEWDVMVMPSRADPFPQAVLEAMAAGVAVVGARRDGIAEQLAGGGGILVEPEDPRALAEAVRALVEDPERRGRQGAAGHARATSRFTLAHSADALEAAWDAALYSTGTR